MLQLIGFFPYIFYKIILFKHKYFRTVIIILLCLLIIIIITSYIILNKSWKPLYLKEIHNDFLNNNCIIYKSMSKILHNLLIE